MKTVSQVMAALKRKGDPARVRAFANHGAPTGAMLGVSVADMKVIAREIRGRQELAHELYETGNADAMYLAGMVADGARMTKRLLDRWAKGASWQMILEYTVPWVATENRLARSLAFAWSFVCPGAVVVFLFGLRSRPLCGAAAEPSAAEPVPSSQGRRAPGRRAPGRLPPRESRSFSAWARPRRRSRST